MLYVIRTILSLTYIWFIQPSLVNILGPLTPESCNLIYPYGCPYYKLTRN